MTQGLMDRLQAKQSVRSFTLEESIAFSELGDQLFNELAERMGTSHDYRLLFEHKLRSDLYEQIQLAAAGYISAVLGSSRVLPEAELLARVLEAREQNQLPNYLGRTDLGL
jgi:hypothetical protein